MFTAVSMPRIYCPSFYVTEQCIRMHIISLSALPHCTAARTNKDTHSTCTDLQALQNRYNGCTICHPLSSTRVVTRVINDVVTVCDVFHSSYKYRILYSYTIYHFVHLISKLDQHFGPNNSMSAAQNLPEGDKKISGSLSLRHVCQAAFSIARNHEKVSK